jgi:ornithine decarboxylase
MSMHRSSLVTVAAKAEATPYRELVEQRGSPLLLLDCDVLREQYKALQAALPSVRLYYAIKSLPHVDALAALAAEGAAFDVATSGELTMLRAIGANPAETIHTHPVKREQDIRDALDFGCDVFVVDNIDELAKFVPFAGRARLLVRVSFRGEGVVSDLSKKFGCELSAVPWLLTEAARLGLTVIGLSFHVGSQSPTPNAHVAAIEACRPYFEDHSIAGTAGLEVLDIGGGFPANYSGESATEDFYGPIRQALASYPGYVRVIAEPGRVISAPAMVSVNTVIGRSRRGDLMWYYLDDGVYGAYSGQIYDHARYPLTVFSDDETAQASVLAGPTCDSIDVIAENTQLPEMQIGDLVVGKQMGAYTLASASEFNSIPRPRVITLHAPKSASESEANAPVRLLTA